LVTACGGLSLIAGYYALLAEKKTGLVYAYIYRYAMTFPVWILLLYEVFKLKSSRWDLRFFL
jgi:hypothetical protein